MKKFFALTVALICLLTSTALANNNVIATYFVVNCKEYVNLWDVPSLHAGNKLAQIPLGQEVGFIEKTRDGNFCKVNYDGLIGYVVSTYLAPIQPD